MRVRVEHRPVRAINRAAIGLTILGIYLRIGWYLLSAFAYDFANVFACAWARRRARRHCCGVTGRVRCTCALRAQPLAPAASRYRAGDAALSPRPHSHTITLLLTLLLSTINELAI